MKERKVSCILILLVYCAFTVACSNSSSSQPAERKIDSITDSRTDADIDKQSTAIKGGAEFYGYNSIFDEELNKLGQISVTEFAGLYEPTEAYKTGISWDITTALFWDEIFQHQGKDVSLPAYDFSLNETEIGVIKKNGFVVSGRHAAPSFAQQYYRIFWNDLPVFITSDSILHAWHRSFDAMLEELEQDLMKIMLDGLLSKMTAELRHARDAALINELKNAVVDVDVFLAVARSLLEGNVVASELNQDDRVLALYDAVMSENESVINLFSRSEIVDFSYFNPRGHYSKSSELQQYFRAVMWLSRIDLRLADNDPNIDSVADMAAAIVINDLIVRAGIHSDWLEFDKLLTAFIGVPDAMLPSQLNSFLAVHNIDDVADINSNTQLRELSTAILDSELGVQNIASIDFTFDNQTANLPRSFSMLAQRFILDGWASTKTTANNILWDDKKVPRFTPHSLDTVFSVFGNTAAVPELVKAMQDQNGIKSRDGLNYQHNLAAVKETIEQQSEASWQNSIYSSWLYTLRALSTPTTNEKYPEAMKTRAWADKTIETQLASWTELRHDAILYAKPPVGVLGLCYYPYGYVEPRPEFWLRMGSMVKNSSTLIKRLIDNDDISVAARYLLGRQYLFLESFANIVKHLGEIADAQLAQQELSEDQEWYLKYVVEVHDDWYWGVTYNGWYPGLFYDSRTDSDTWDALVTDVQSTPQSEEYDGHVFTQATGDVNLMVIAIENAGDRVVYLGPTLSHYELYLPSQSHLSDDEWKEIVRQGELPAAPDRTNKYLVTATPILHDEGIYEPIKCDFWLAELGEDPYVEDFDSSFFDDEMKIVIIEAYYENCRHLF